MVVISHPNIIRLIKNHGLVFVAFFGLYSILRSKLRKSVIKKKKSIHKVMTNCRLQVLDYILTPGRFNISRSPFTIALSTYSYRKGIVLKIKKGERENKGKKEQCSIKEDHVERNQYKQAKC